uniref:Uncharacterized protein n=1 Tax=Helicotheca tamesis TaxID=374047 RepID=A0A7S2MGA4_9STRA|mmetsp:Transcript_15604/g.21334  ORF Transcript_15604/g.21334 Transcript_15604/m.21334 type:complete len:237 (+) Transcript_15604:88-798(+)
MMKLIAFLAMIALSDAFDCPGFPAPFDIAQECDGSALFEDFPGDSTTLSGAELEAYTSFCCYMNIPRKIPGGPSVFVESRIDCCVADDIIIDAYGDKQRIPSAGAGPEQYSGLDDFRARTTKPALAPRPPGAYSLSDHRVKAIVNNLVILRNFEQGTVGSTGNSWAVEKVLFFHFEEYRMKYIQVWSDTLPIADAFCEGDEGLVCKKKKKVGKKGKKHGRRLMNKVKNAYEAQYVN